VESSWFGESPLAPAHQESEDEPSDRRDDDRHDQPDGWSDDQHHEGSGGEGCGDGENYDVRSFRPDAGQFEPAGQAATPFGEDLADLVGREVGSRGEGRRLLSTFSS